MPVAAGETVSLTLPGFSGAEGQLALATPEDVSLAARLTATWDTAASKLNICVLADTEGMPTHPPPFSLSLSLSLVSYAQHILILLYFYPKQAC